MNEVKDIKPDPNLVSKCGLFCAACRAYLKGRCNTCADCKTIKDPVQCKKLNNFISKIFSFIFGSDRIAGILKIKKIGRSSFAMEMAKAGKMHLRKENRNI